MIKLATVCIEFLPLFLVLSLELASTLKSISNSSLPVSVLFAEEDVRNQGPTYPMDRVLDVGTGRLRDGGVWSVRYFLRRVGVFDFWVLCFALLIYWVSLLLLSFP